MEKVNCSCKVCNVSPKSSTHEIQTPSHKVTSGNEYEDGHLPEQLGDTKERRQQGWEEHLHHSLIARVSEIREEEHPAQICSQCLLKRAGELAEHHLGNEYPWEQMPTGDLGLSVQIHCHQGKMENHSLATCLQSGRLPQ